MNFQDLELWPLVGIPLLIFCARICDVTMGTLRIALISRGLLKTAPLAGFFESLIWLVAIGQVVKHLDTPIHYLAWAGGYATGTYFGVLLEEKLALGLISVRVITENDASDLLQSLGQAAFGVTSFAARGLQGRVRLIFSVIRRRELGRYLEIVREQQPKAFISISDVRTATEGFFAGPRHQLAEQMGRARSK